MVWASGKSGVSLSTLRTSLRARTRRLAVRSSRASARGRLGVVISAPVAVREAGFQSAENPFATLTWPLKGAAFTRLMEKRRPHYDLTSIKATFSTVAGLRLTVRA